MFDVIIEMRLLEHEQDTQQRFLILHRFGEIDCELSKQTVFRQSLAQLVFW